MGISSFVPVKTALNRSGKPAKKRLTRPEQRERRLAKGRAIAARMRASSIHRGYVTENGQDKRRQTVAEARESFAQAYARRRG